MAESPALWTATDRRWPRTIATFLAISSLCAATGAASAQGGKAEPLRIEFARGRNSASVGGTLRGDAQREYAFVARKNQRLTIATTATPPGSIAVQVKRPGGMRLSLVPGQKQTWSAVLTESGEHLIWVNRSRPASGRSQYTLTLTIR
jgi:hypothetical protein